jgi:hypothetical protein
MSKSDGLKIGIRFTEDLVGNISEKNMDMFVLPKGTFSASNTVSGYPVENAFDGNTNTFWYNYWGGNAQWIQVQLASPTLITGFRWSNVTGYRPKDFKLQGSVNGATWIDIHTNTSPNTDGFKEFTFESVTYQYYRWTFLNYHSSYVQLSELELRVKVGNEKAFNILGKEYKYVNGSLIDRVYEPISIELHPTEPKSVLLTFDWQNRFNNAEDKIKVLYDASKGSLTGAGGAVESFEIEFTPEDLIQTPNPNEEELIKAYPYEIVLDLNELTFINAYSQEYVKAYPYEIVLELKHVSEINP